MKSIMTSVSPYLCEKIANGNCKILVRKSAPKEVPFKDYIYATKPKRFYKWGAASTSDELLWLANGKVEMGDGFKFWADCNAHQCLNGRVIGEFICDRIEIVNAECSDYGIDLFYHDCLTNGGLTEREIEKYFNIPEDRDLRAMKGNGYVWNISNLKIYDKPKELSEFRKALDRVYCSYFKDYCEEGCVSFGSTDYVCNDYWKWEKGLTHPPQSWVYVEELRNE